MCACVRANCVSTCAREKDSACVWETDTLTSASLRAISAELGSRRRSQIPALSALVPPQPGLKPRGQPRGAPLPLNIRMIGMERKLENESSGDFCEFKSTSSGSSHVPPGSTLLAQVYFPKKITQI